MALHRLVSRRAGGFVLAMLLACAAAPARAQASQQMLANAIRVAGEQRVLAERITKAWSLLGLGNENRHPRVQLFEAVEHFEALLAELEAHLVDRPRLHAGLEELGRRWRVFERIAVREPVRSRALELLAAEEQVVAAGDRLARALAAETHEPAAHMLDLASRQAMLAQRLVKSYVFLSWGFDEARVLDRFVSSWNDYEAAQAQLEAFPGNTPELRDALADAAEEWGWLKSALSLYRADSFYPGIIDDSGEKILDDIARIVALYHDIVELPGTP